MEVWPCRVCGQVFKSYGNAYQHRRLHSTVRPYVCKKNPCCRSFWSFSDYQAHCRGHTNRRLYACRLCGKRFVHRNHQHLHRCGIGRNKLYYCHMCPQIFREILTLAQHKRKAHAKAISVPKRQRHCKAESSIKKPKIQDLNTKNVDSKILLKITAGKSTTIISPLKKSTSSHGKRKKDKAKKSKRKQKDDSPKNSIILSIKKGSVKMSSETKLKVPKQNNFKRSNGLVNRVVESCDMGSNLKMKIKTFTDKSASPLRNEALNRHSLPSSPSIKKHKNVTSKCSSDTETKVVSVLNDCSVEESKVRNGIVIVKDKSGKFLAEQLQSAKAKKRENVFDSFSDAGLWKVLPSPRHDSSLDYLKLRLSPQKPLRLDSGIDLPCEKASRYLDVNVPGKSLKVETYSEDSDVFETSPGVDKDSDPGLQNVNDSGIEILSSSSCNRSNGNSVRSVLLDDNSPNYFQTEDSLLSLDSPVTDIHLKAEQNLCTKCGGTFMETNNNSHSPRKCRCSMTMVQSPSQAASPAKVSTHSISQDHQTTPSADTHGSHTNNGHHKLDMESDNNKSDSKHGNETDDSDIVLLGNSDEINKADNVSEYDDVEIIRDVGSSNRKQNDLKLRLKLKSRKTPVSNNKKTVKVSDIEGESIVYTEMGEEHMIGNSQHKMVNVAPKCETGRLNSNLLEGYVYGNPSLSGNEGSPVPMKDNSVLCQNAHSSLPVTKKDLTSSTAETNKSSEEKISSEMKITNINESISDLQKCHNGPDILSLTEIVNTDFEYRHQNNKECLQNQCLTEKEITKTKVAVPYDCDIDNKECIKSSNTQLLIENERTESEPCKKEIKKKPLFKSKSKKHSMTSNIGDDINKVINDTPYTEIKEDAAGSEQVNHVRKKKPIFKKRSSSGDSNSELSIKTETALKLEIAEPGMDADSALVKVNQTDEIKLHSDKIYVLPSIESELKSTTKGNSNLMDDPEQQEAGATEPLVLDLKDNNFKPQLEDNDSLQQIPCIENKVESTKNTSKKLCTSPLDLFQQQFLSFLSSNKPVSSEEKSKEQSTGQNNKEIKPQNDNKIEEMNTDKHVESTDNLLVSGREKDLSKSVANNNILKSASDKRKEKLALKKPKPESKIRSKSPVENYHKGPSKTVEKHVKEKGHLLEIQKEKEKKCKGLEISGEPKEEVISFGLMDKKSNMDHSHLENRTDSLSWLKIFSESIENKSIANKDASISEEITDFSADLAAINNKMDASDDELNNLDVDHVFKSTNLASLQPISIGNTNKAQIKRPQKAKRSIGPLKRSKRIIESDSDFSDSCDSGSNDLQTNADHDSDYNPFHDSDGDFDMAPVIAKQKKRKSVNKHPFDDFESDSDELTGIQTDHEALHSSRTKRLKQGRKSCCPCCLGLPEKASREFHPHHKYRLPKNSKQFVKSSMKLLELQAKIHQLFLSLFPDCAEIISNSKIGTEEFEILIEEVLGSLEDQDISFEAATVHPSHSHIQGLYTCENDLFCNSHNLHIHNRAGTNDIIKTEGVFNECCKASDCIKENDCCTQSGSECCTQPGSECCRNKDDECLNSKSCPGQSYGIHKYAAESAVKPHSTSNTANELNIASTVTSYSDMKGAFHSPSASPSVTCEPQTTAGHSHPSPHTEPTVSPWNDIESMSCEDAGDLCMLDSDITITIDLNAAKVSLCRDPKHCLERLHNRIARLVQCLLPKVKLKKPFFRNFDNLHFLLDLLITANLPGSNSNVPSSDDEIEPTQTDLIDKKKKKVCNTEISDKHVSDRLKIPKKNDSTKSPRRSDTIKSTKKTKQKAQTSETKKSVKDKQASPEERVPLLSKFQDMFEQEIKSHRESLKKDVFDSHTSSENMDQTSLQKATEVLTAIKKIEKLNKVKQNLRPRRDPRLRKRNEAESRKLFVQEKILNSQNSTIVCHTSPKKSSKFVRKSRKKTKDRQNLKESFLSGLDLGEIKQQQTQSDSDIATAILDGDPEVKHNTEVTEETKMDTNEVKRDTEDKNDEGEIISDFTENTTEEVKNTADTVSVTTDSVTEVVKDGSVDTEISNDLTTVHEKGEVEGLIPDQQEDRLVPEDPDSRQKSGEKNIFELMQPL